MTVSPSARLTLHLLSTWGDRNFVGLAGLEVLNRDGRQVEVQPGLGRLLALRYDPPAFYQIHKENRSRVLWTDSAVAP